MQSKKNSVIEAFINTLIGFLISLLVTPIINLLCGIEATGLQNTAVVVLMTIISFLRSYIIRRYCNQYLDDINYKIQQLL